MAKQICNTTIRKGVGILVENQKPSPTASSRYINFYFAFPDKVGGRCVMFTEKEVASFFDRPSLIDVWDPDRGNLYSSFIGGHRCWVVQIEWQGKTKLVRIPAGTMKGAIKRADKNPEDVTNPSWLARIFG